MKRLSINKTRLARGTARVLLACAGVLTVSAIVAQSPIPASRSTPTPTSQPQWPSPEAKRELIKIGFGKALTRAARNQAYRDRLTNFANQREVKIAVQEQLRLVEGLGTEEIPPEIVLIFYVPKAIDSRKAGERAMSEEVRVFLANNENRNYHVFYLPPFNANDATTEYIYDNHIKCCYRPW